MLKQAINFYCAARGHALAVWLRLALMSPLRSDPLIGQTSSAPGAISIFHNIFHNQKNECKK